LNTSAAAAWVERSVPVGVQDEVSAAWDGMRGFSEEQWEPAMEHALRKREARLAEEAKQADAIMDGTWLESLFGVDLGGGGKEASAAVGSEKVGGGGGVFSAESSQERSRPSVATALYGEPDGDEAAAAERRRMAEWSLAGPQPWRPVLTSLFFTFALFDACRGKWTAYPTTVKESPLSGQGTPN